MALEGSVGPGIWDVRIAELYTLDVWGLGVGCL